MVISLRYFAENDICEEDSSFVKMTFVKMTFVKITYFAGDECCGHCMPSFYGY